MIGCDLIFDIILQGEGAGVQQSKFTLLALFFHIEATYGETSNST